MSRRWMLLLAAALLFSSGIQAQTPPVPQPGENPITEQKRVLGKILFWEDQLSSDRSIACGTCHISGNGGADPRIGVHPGADGLFETFADNVNGSPGVIRADTLMRQIEDTLFGFDTQVTGRAANPTVGAAFAGQLFWDGRAGTTFVDPETGATAIVSGGALENQAIGPILSDVEMAKEGREWSDVKARLASVAPLAYAANIPADVSAVLEVSPTYADLFEAAFGTTEINAQRIAFAIATYERTLVPDQTPWDDFINGNGAAMTPRQVQGWNAFNANQCSACHQAPLFSDFTFRNIGVRPPDEDLGRQGITGNPLDRGRFKVPSLRNVGLKRTYMHTGRILSVQDAVAFYLPGNQPSTDSVDPLLPIPMPAPVVADIADFLENGLTDARVANETFPFDRPTLFGGAAQSLEFPAGGSTLQWPSLGPAVQSYTVYRGLLSGLVDANLDGLPDAGYGDCVSVLDPNLSDTLFEDAQVPAPDAGFYYLRAFIDLNGDESRPGASSSGLPRQPAAACP